MSEQDDWDDWDEEDSDDQRRYDKEQNKYYNMTPKEKAQDIYERFCLPPFYAKKMTLEESILIAKSAALNHVCEIIKEGGTMYVHKLNDGSMANGKLYWIEVRNELFKMK